ncbi:MAG: class I SAM-dependent methyltransferase [Pseudomonadota bacterium]
MKYKFPNIKKPTAPTEHSSTKREAVFTDIYNSNRWADYGEANTPSGMGSTLYNTTIIRKELPHVIKKYGVKTFLDAPCGDFNWMEHVALPKDVSYIGCDIVPDLISDLSARYGAQNRTFHELDIVSGEAPEADMWMCRDALFHLTLEDGVKCLKNVSKARIQYFLSTTYEFVETNTDINTGSFRAINLCKPPYSLPEPIYAFDDFLAPHPPRIMGVWTAEQLADRFSDV